MKEVLQASNVIFCVYHNFKISKPHVQEPSTSFLLFCSQKSAKIIPRHHVITQLIKFPVDFF